MPQKSPVYAVTRIRVHEKDMVKPERMARMAEASPAEVMRALGDIGYGGISDPQLSDGDRMIAKELSDAYALINEVTFSPEQTDLFILKGDANNLKLLIKQRLTGTADSPALMKGVYPKDDIIRMVHNADYRELPEEFTKRLNALEQSFSGEIDPGRISTEIDRAYLEHCLNNAIWEKLIRFHSGVMYSRKMRLPATGARGSSSAALFSFRLERQALQVARPMTAALMAMLAAAMPG